ncbi:MAG: nicotinate (nicotinamide) nucleotide adenylyltransferase [Clostridia bacterium]|nr:nicotinate (nicotinamide) nucleotide adenylyltransferase [Clostridia bacterium]
MSDRVKRLALFGGSFSPPHNGHVEAALNFLRASEADELVIMPSGLHPCKRLGSEVEDKDRLEMCRLAFESDARFGGRCRVSDMEIAKSGVSYTCDTLERLKDTADEIYMLVGADVLCGMENWKDAERVFKLAVICCARRGDAAAEDAARRYAKKYGARVTMLDTDELPLSSHTVRRAAGSGGLLTGLVPHNVEVYIRENSLYGANAMTEQERFSEEALSRLREIVRGKMSEKRFSHTLGVERKAAELCAVYAPEKTGMMRAAALLHDVTKELKKDEQIYLCAKYGITVDGDVLAAPKLFHSITAAAMIPDKFPEFAVPELIRAVSVHTSGAEDMTLCDKLLYLADYIEDTRTFPDCVELREFFDKGIAAAKTAEDREKVLRDTMLLSFDMTIRNILDEQRPLAVVTVRSRNAILKECRE